MDKELRRGTWRAVVMTHVEALRCEVEALGGSAGEGPAEEDPAVVCVRETLDRAASAASGRSWPKAWWNGVRIERAWRCVHEAEALLAPLQHIERIRVRYPEVLGGAHQLLPASDPRRAAIKKWLAADPTPARSPAGTREEREQFVAALRWVNGASDKAHARVRSFRNVVVATTVAMTLVAGGLVLVGSIARDALPVCVEPTQAATDVAETPTPQRVCPTGGAEPTGGDVPLVAFVGLVGAALASAVSIRKLRGTSTPYSVPLALAVLKLPSGALTALAGLLLIQGQFVPGLSALDDPAQVLSYSIILGYGQEAFTRLVDRQGQRVLDNAPGPDMLQPGGDQAAAATADPASV